MMLSAYESHAASQANVLTPTTMFFDWQIVSNRLWCRLGRGAWRLESARADGAYRRGRGLAREYRHQAGQADHFREEFDWRQEITGRSAVEQLAGTIVTDQKLSAKSRARPEEGHEDIEMAFSRQEILTHTCGTRSLP